MIYAKHAPNRMHYWLFDQDEVWIDIYGNEHNLADMPASYLHNVVGMLFRGAPGYSRGWAARTDMGSGLHNERRAARDKPHLFIAQRKLVKALYAEIDKRERVVVEHPKAEREFKVEFTLPKVQYVAPRSSDNQLFEDWYRNCVTRDAERKGGPDAPEAKLPIVTRMCPVSQRPCAGGLCSGCRYSR